MYVKAVFQEWIDHANKKILWSLSTSREKLDEITKEIEASGKSKTGEAIEVPVSDTWDRIKDLEVHGTVFLKDRHDLIVLF